MYLDSACGPQLLPCVLQVVDPELEMINPADWDVVCDVRTPDEFEEDRLIGAINTPVLSNEQRAEVGTLYKQVYAHNPHQSLMHTQCLDVFLASA